MEGTLLTMGLPRLGRRQERDQGFAEYYASRGAVMRNTAYLLCGDWHLAEDLTQTAFTKLYLAWRRVDRHEALDQYLRRTLVRVYLDEKRRPWRREYATEPGAVFDEPVLDPGAEDRLVLLSALAAVPPRQRAALVLRFWADLPVEQVADILGCSTGTVKSQTARGLQALRGVLDHAQPATAGESREGTDE
jgi:RNA polymerase sigma-70 factor (sigma-E family)